MEGPYSRCGLYFTVRGVSFLLVSETYEPQTGREEQHLADILITDGLPEEDLGGSHMTTVMSLPEDELQVLYNKAYLEMETVNLYTTGGRGNLLIDVEDHRNLKIRRGD